MRGDQRGHLRAGGGQRPSGQARPGSGKNQARSQQGNWQHRERKNKKPADTAKCLPIFGGPSGT